MGSRFCNVIVVGAHHVAHELDGTRSPSSTLVGAVIHYKATNRMDSWSLKGRNARLWEMQQMRHRPSGGSSSMVVSMIENNVSKSHNCCMWKGIIAWLGELNQMRHGPCGRSSTLVVAMIDYNGPSSPATRTATSTAVVAVVVL